MTPLILATVLLAQTDIWAPVRRPQPAPEANQLQPPGAELGYAEAYRRCQDGETMVVVLGADWCQPCRLTWSDLQPLRQRLALVHVDIDTEQGRKLSEGSTIPQVIVYRRVLGKWRTVRHVGRLRLRDAERIVDEVERQQPARKPIGSAADGGGVSDPLTRLRSLPAPSLALVDPPTWQAYYEHVTLDHGVRVDMARPLDIAALRLVHSHAHDRTLPAEWYR